MILSALHAICIILAVIGIADALRTWGWVAMAAMAVGLALAAIATWRLSRVIDQMKGDRQ